MNVDCIFLHPGPDARQVPFGSRLAALGHGVQLRSISDFDVSERHGQGILMAAETLDDLDGARVKQIVNHPLTIPVALAEPGASFEEAWFRRYQGIELWRVNEDPSELRFHLSTLETRLTLLKSLHETADHAHDVALQAMTAASELSVYISIIERSHELRDRTQLAHALLEVTRSFGLVASVWIIDAPPVFISDSGEPDNGADLALLEHHRADGRIVDSGSRTLFNATHLSLLVKNMPVTNPVRCGELKDNLCILLHAMDARIQAIRNEQRWQQQRTSAAELGRQALDVLRQCQTGNDAGTPGLGTVTTLVEQLYHTLIPSAAPEPMACSTTVSPQADTAPVTDTKVTLF